MTHQTNYKQKWIKNPWFDAGFILAPPFLALGVAALLPHEFKYSSSMTIMAWFMLVILVDVAHVYTTLFNTYLEPDRFRRHKLLFVLIPIMCYVGGFLLHLVNGAYFWHGITYLAVFHFVRQQYGFMRIYSARDVQSASQKWLDNLIIYAATIYPLVYWHCTPERNFNWFVPGDFFYTRSEIIKHVSFIIYVFLIGAYFIKELHAFIKERVINIPKNLIIIGTLISWYFGIIYYNGDVAFTLLNVVTHGIPYMALVWTGMQSRQIGKTNLAGGKKNLSGYAYGIIIYIFAIVFLAYIEEGLWDGFVWRDHPGLFALFHSLPRVSDPWVLAALVPLLSLPQTTHYVLDGFIWKRDFA